jgi:hypothetical protein
VAIRDEHVIGTDLPLGDGPALKLDEGCLDAQGNPV